MDVGVSGAVLNMNWMAEETVAADGPTGGPSMLACRHDGAGGCRERASSGGGRPRPPMLQRQNASRFSWPPDSGQEWTYILLSPVELAKNATRVLGMQLTALDVACFFARADAAVSRAYAAYSSRWRRELDDARAR